MAKALSERGKSFYVSVERKPVSSSNIKAIGYSKNDQVLTVEFHNSDIWGYHPVSETQWDDLLSSGSIGKHFNTNIKTNPQIADFKLSK